MKPALASKLTRRHVDIAGAGLCLVLALPFCFARINPLLRPRSAAAAQESSLAILHGNVRALKASIQAEKKALAGLNDALSGERIDLESARHINGRIARLADLAAGSGLEVDEIVPGQAAPGPRYDRVPIRLRGNGTYPTCAAFLCKLARTVPDISVVSFELSADPQKPAKPAAFAVNLIWYAAAGDAPSPAE